MFWLGKRKTNESNKWTRYDGPPRCVACFVFALLVIMNRTLWHFRCHSYKLCFDSHMRMCRVFPAKNQSKIYRKAHWFHKPFDRTLYVMCFNNSLHVRTKCAEKALGINRFVYLRWVRITQIIIPKFLQQLTKRVWRLDFSSDWFFINYFFSLMYRLRYSAMLPPLASLHSFDKYYFDKKLLFPLHLLHFKWLSSNKRSSFK